MKDVLLGDLQVSQIVELVDGLPLGMVLPDFSRADLARLRQWYWDGGLDDDPAKARFDLSIHSYVLRVDGLNVLIDTCNGNDKARIVPFANQLNTPYLDRLADLGLTPDDIHIVMCTHLHCDHVGWNTRLIDGRWVPTFPNARYVFSRRDYEHFSEQTEEQLHRDAYLDSVLPVVEAGQAEMVESDAAIHRTLGDGVWLEDASGHSPGCCVIKARRGGDLALFSGDVIHHPMQLVRPDLPFFADHDPARAVRTRQRLLERHADTDTVFFPAHFQQGGAGRVMRDGDGFRYEFLDRGDAQ